MMRRIPAFNFIVALLLLLSMAGCSNVAPSSQSMTEATATPALSENSTNISADSTIASVEVFKDIVCMIYVMKEDLGHSFLLGGDGDPASVSMVFYSDPIAVFGGDRKVCLTKKDAGGDWMYYILDCNYFGSGDYRVLGNKNGTYVAMSDYSNQILILNVETKKVSLLRFDADESVSFISWDSDVLYFNCQSSAIPAYTYDVKTDSINSVSQESEIPEIQSQDPNEYDYDQVIREVFDIN